MRTNIAGEFQKSNLAAALQTAELICGRLDEHKIYEALSQIRISGRMEEIAPGIIVDVSHNIQGMQGFVQTVEANYHGMKKRILFAASHQNEEEYMKSIHDPELPIQQREHKAFAEKINTFKLDESSPEAATNSLNELLLYLTRWLYSHILSSDMMIGKMAPETNVYDAFAFTDKYII